MRLSADCSRTTPLVALVHASAEWRVGLPPTCEAVVRWLDRVCFTVHPGECVVVQHDDPAGVRVLLAALTGHPRLLAGQRLTGERHAQPGIRWRRASIRVDLVAPLIEGWQESVGLAPARKRSAEPARDGVRCDAVSTVHVLRASRRAPHAASAAAPGDADRWRAWATGQRASGGALVIVTDEPLPRRAPMHDARPSGPESAMRGRLKVGVRETAPDAVVRRCRLQHGRVLPEHAAARYAGGQYCWPSEAPLVLGP